MITMNQFVFTVVGLLILHHLYFTTYPKIRRKRAELNGYKSFPYQTTHFIVRPYKRDGGTTTRYYFPVVKHLGELGGYRVYLDHMGKYLAVEDKYAGIKDEFGQSWTTIREYPSYEALVDSIGIT